MQANKKTSPPLPSPSHMSLIDWKSTEATRIAAHTIRMLGEPDVIQAEGTAGRAVWKNAPIVAMANPR